MIWLLPACALLLAAGGLREATARRRLELVGTPAVRLTAAPARLQALAVALGPFRGLLADFLWLRADRLEEEGRMAEMAQLAQWITQLDARNPDVWGYQAWNLAYNLSAQCPAAADRWRWVRHGLDLLGGQGLRVCPMEPRLYLELAWLFLHKISSDADLFHEDYQRAWAAEVVGGAAEPGLHDLAHTLDPATVGELEQRFGPLDWRLAAAHALYWAWRGRALAEGYDRAALDRIIDQALRDLVFQGRLYEDESRGDFILLPNPQLIPAARAWLRESAVATPTVQVEFLADALVLAGLYGDDQAARDIYAELVRLHPDWAQGSHWADEDAARLVQDPARQGYRPLVLAQIEAGLRKSVEEERQGRLPESRAAADEARATWERYMRQDPSPEWRQRMGLPPIATLERMVRTLEAPASRPRASGVSKTRPPGYYEGQ